MKTFRVILLILIASSFIGCASQRMYSWGNYSDTLYAYKKDPSDATLSVHMKELEKIIEDSNTKTLRVPPGVYAELGYYYLKNNQDSKAVEYFYLEKQLYPESTILMERLIQKSNAANNASTKETSKVDIQN